MAGAAEEGNAHRMNTGDKLGPYEILSAIGAGGTTGG